MNRKLLIIGIILLSIILSACQSDYLKVSNTIKSPTLESSPINGKWILTKYINMKNNTEDSNVVGEYALFKNENIIVGDCFSDSVTYSTKNVSAEEYLLYKYRMQPKDLEIKNERIDIISLYSDEQYILEIIKLSDYEIVAKKDNKFLYYRKVSDLVTYEEIISYIDSVKSSMNNPNLRNLGENSFHTGILLGLKKETMENDIKKWDYRTIYLKFDELNNVNYYEVQDILLPRKMGFYDVKVKRKNYMDEIYIKSRDERENLLVHKSDFLKNILYIGNDYVSIENSKKGNVNNLSIYPLDYLDRNDGILLSDILDKDILDKIEKEMEKTEGNKRGFDERNFGLERRNGYWTLIGRENYKVDNKIKFKDYNIKALTPKSIVNYDELSIPWNYIKTNISDLVDAFTSPNGDILIVQTYNSIEAYPIKDNKIINKKILQIDTRGEESIIMNEWANGIYADMWEDEILSKEKNQLN